MLDELRQFLSELPGVMIQRRHVGIPGYVLDELGDSTSKGIEPVILREGALGPDHARHLIDEAVKGTPFAINHFGAVEVLLDHRQNYDQTMLVHDRLNDADNPLLFGNGTPLCVLHTTFVWKLLHGGSEKHRKHAAAVVGFVEDQLDFVVLGHRYERLQRLVVIAAQEAARGIKKHPAVKKLHDRVGRLVLTTT